MEERYNAREEQTSFGTPTEEDNARMRKFLQNQIRHGLEKALKKTPHSTQDREYWSKIARVALPRFPELERGESIYVSEIKRRLGQIRKAGYDLKLYSRMSKGEAWEYLMQIRAYVRGRAERYCPDILARIDAINEQAKIERREMR